MKQKMSEEKKAILMYSGELIFIALIFLTLGILKFVGVFNTSETGHKIFTFVTICGGTWIITDFFWSNFSAKRKKKVTLIDKYLILPAGIFLVVFDIFCFCNNWYKDDTALWKNAIGALFLYISIVYIFEGIFHYYHPTKELLRAIEEDNKEKEKPVPEAEEQKEKENDNNTKV